MPENPTTVSDLTTDEIREWLCDWLLVDAETNRNDVLVDWDAWFNNVDPDNDFMRDWYRLRDELLAEYAERNR